MARCTYDELARMAAASPVVVSTGYSDLGYETPDEVALRIEFVRHFDFNAGQRREVGVLDTVVKSDEAGHGVRAPGARRYRLHLGARPALLHEARAARPARVRRRVVASRALGGTAAAQSGSG